MTISTPTDTYEADFAQRVQQIIYYYIIIILLIQQAYCFCGSALIAIDRLRHIDLACALYNEDLPEAL